MREKAKKFVSLFTLAFTVGTLTLVVLSANLQDRIARKIERYLNPESASRDKKLAEINACLEKQNQESDYLFVGCNGFF